MSSDLVSSPEFLAILNGSSDPIGIVDARGRFTWVNEAVALFFGFAPERLLGTHFRDHLAEDERPGDAMRRAQMGHPAAVVRRIRREDGSTAVLRTELIPIGDSGSVLIHGTDLTVLYETVDRAEAASSGLAPGVAGDLGGLLAAALGHLEAAGPGVEAAREAIRQAAGLLGDSGARPRAGG